MKGPLDSQVLNLFPILKNEPLERDINDILADLEEIEWLIYLYTVCS